MPLTATQSPAAKSLEDSLSVNVIVANCTPARAAALLVIVTVGADIFYAVKKAMPVGENLESILLRIDADSSVFASMPFR